MEESHSDIARMLQRLGQEGVSAERLDDVYSELRDLAAKLMNAERSSHTLQPTALVNEAFLRLSKSRDVGDDHAEFLAAAAVTMRRILVDHAREKNAKKRGSGAERITLTGLTEATDSHGLDVLALHDALGEFEQLDPRAAKIVELRFFGGMTGEQIASHLGLSRNTVVRELSMARSWLKRALRSRAEE